MPLTEILCFILWRQERRDGVEIFGLSVILLVKGGVVNCHAKRTAKRFEKSYQVRGTAAYLRKSFIEFHGFVWLENANTTAKWGNMSFSSLFEFHYFLSNFVHPLQCNCNAIPWQYTFDNHCSERRRKVKSLLIAVYLFMIVCLFLLLKIIYDWVVVCAAMEAFCCL